MPIVFYDHSLENRVDSGNHDSMILHEGTIVMCGTPEGGSVTVNVGGEIRLDKELSGLQTVQCLATAGILWRFVGGTEDEINEWLIANKVS